MSPSCLKQQGKEEVSSNPMFVDTATLTLSAGKGGDGIIAWRREKFIPKGGPAGGNGGRGGSLFLKADQQVLSLEGFRHRKKICAPSGRSGGSGNRQGSSGEDLTLKVPCGTLVRDAATKEVLFDLTEQGQSVEICKGGRGGKGNNCFKTATNQAPLQCTPGTAGTRVDVELELKLIADVGLVGFPNAGKSTLLSTITHVPVKIAPYPFTTLFPNLSYVEFEDFSRILVADIPGLIENAHLNRGLGFSFLKHIERTSVLLYVLDASGLEERDPIADFAVLQNELKAYSPQLLNKPFLIALSKMDAEGSEEISQAFTKAHPALIDTIFKISAHTGEGIPPLLQGMRSLAQRNGKRFV